MWWIVRAPGTELPSLIFTSKRRAMYVAKLAITRGYVNKTEVLDSTLKVRYEFARQDS